MATKEPTRYKMVEPKTTFAAEAIPTKLRKMPHTLDNHQVPEDVELYINYAESLARKTQWKEALDVLAAGHQLLQRSYMSTLVDILCEPWLTSGVPSFSQRLKHDVFSCAKCNGVLFEPVTLWCGHSYCRKCTTNLTKCTTCGQFQSNTADLKTNVTMAALVDKFWTPELTAVKLRNEGNNLFANNCHQEALEKYNKAANVVKDDFALLSNRSNLLHKMGHYSDALADANRVIRLKPDWPKGHFRQAVANRALGQNEEALIALLQCVAYEKKLLPEIKEDIVKVLLAIIISAAKSNNSGHLQHQKRKECDVGASCGGSEGSEDDSSDGESLRREKAKSEPSLLPVTSHSQLHKLVDQMASALKRMKEGTVEYTSRRLDQSQLQLVDVECTLCYRLLWQPVSTPCGHTFCRTCLDRALDHNSSCPLCKTSLEQYLAERRQNLNQFLDTVMGLCLPDDYAERSCINEEELNEMASLNKIPIFVCTLAFPTVRCPLHVFEPRYRLMIRRCMESGTRQFGMCSYILDQPQGFSEYGTMLEVRDVEFFADGRSVVDTVGGRRFKVLSRGMLDGYATANVEFLVDDEVAPERVPALTQLHDTVRQAAQDWINTARASIRDRITQHFGTMPPLEADWVSLANGPAWLWWLVAILPLTPKDQLVLLSMKDLQKRLEAVQRVVEYVRRRTT